MLSRPGDRALLFGAAMGFGDDGGDNQTFGINLDAQTLNLVGTVNNNVVIYGNHDAVGFVGSGAETVTDMGSGSAIVVIGDIGLEVAGFANDPTGHVFLPAEIGSPLVQSDGQDGTLITDSYGGVMHFIGATVSADQIISNIAPTMAFIPPPPPSPPVAPIADPPPPTPPPAPAPDPNIVVTGNNQPVILNGATNTTVVDHGTGTLIELINACQISVDGFGAPTGPGTSTPGADHTGRVLFENQGLYAQTVAYDGHGGTLVQVGNASVDFLGISLYTWQIGFTNAEPHHLLEVAST